MECQGMAETLLRSVVGSMKRHWQVRQSAATPATAGRVGGLGTHSHFVPNEARDPSVAGANSSRDWRNKVSEIFILEGLQPIARGRGAIATTTPGFCVLFYLHPERRASDAGCASEVRTLCDRLTGSNLSMDQVPRVFVAIAPRPGATISDPCRDQADLIECGRRHRSGRACVLAVVFQVRDAI